MSSTIKTVTSRDISVTDTSLQTAYSLLGFILLIVGLVGYLNTLSTLGLALLLSILFLLFSKLKRKARRITIIDVWILAFVYLFGSEYILESQKVASLFGNATLRSVEGIIVAAFGTSLLGFTSTIGFITSKLVPRVRKHPESGGTRTNPNLISLAIFMAMILIAILYIMIVVTPDQLLNVARYQRRAAYDIGGFDLPLRTVLILIPSISIYLFLKYRLPPVFQMIFLGTSILAILSIYAMGTRFYLGFTVSGIFTYLYTTTNKLSWKQVGSIILLLIVLLLVQGVVREGRTSGLTSQSPVQQLKELKVDSFLSPEALLTVDAWVISYRIYRISERLPEHFFLFYWWIPRSLWPEKPTIAGHWIPHEVVMLQNISSGHSMDGGFVLPALIDFGPIGGVIFSVCYGVLLATFEALSIRYRTCLHHPNTVLTGLLYFGTFFMMRSLLTSLIFISTSLVVLLPFLLAERRTSQA